MQQENFSPQDSLRVIQSMLEKSKQDMRGNDVYFLMWGWLSFIAIIGQFILKVMIGFQYHYLIWLITIVGMALSVIYTIRQKKQRKVSSYIGESMGYLWTGIGISFSVLSIIISTSIGWLHAWPFFILFYGLGTFISGKFIHFKPLVIGGIVCWILSCVAVFVPYDYQLLIAALAILCSYIIPGYLLKSEKITTAYGR